MSKKRDQENKEYFYSGLLPEFYNLINRIWDEAKPIATNQDYT